MYGKGAGFRQAGVQIINLRLEAVGLTPKPVLNTIEAGSVSGDQAKEMRDVYWPELKESRPTAIYLGTDLVDGQQLVGPAIVEQDFTTVVIHPGDSAVIDRYGNIVINVALEKVG
jgi:N-methylhydantoinase A